MRPDEPLSLMVTLLNEQRIKIPGAVVGWSRGQEFVVRTMAIEPYTQARLAHSVKQFVLQPLEPSPSSYQLGVDDSSGLNMPP